MPDIAVDYGSHRPPLLALVGEKFDAIIARSGAFRMTKDAGYFLATVDG